MKSVYICILSKKYANIGIHRYAHYLKPNQKTTAQQLWSKIFLLKISNRFSLEKIQILSLSEKLWTNVINFRQNGRKTIIRSINLS